VEEGSLHFCQDPDKSIHVLCKIEIFPVADIEAASVLNPFDWVDIAVGIQLRRHLDVVDRTDKYGIAGYCRALAHFDAHGFEKDPGLDVIHGKQPVLGGADAVACLAGDKGFIFGFRDTDLGAGGNPFCDGGIFAGEKHQIFVFNKDIVQFLILRISGKAGQIQRAFQDHGLNGGGTEFVQLQIHHGKQLLKSGESIGQDLHGSLNRDP